jgi:YHS domain-containing protein
MTRHLKILTILSAFISSLIFMGAATQESTPKRIGDAYPLATCPVSGNPLGDNPVVVVLSETPRASDKGREVRFCCNGCRGNFEKDLKTNLPELDKKIIKAQMPYFPAGNCVVMTDEPIAASDSPEAMTEGKNVVIGNRLYRFCCKACVRKFKKDQKKYDDMLAEMIIKQQSESYPLEVCVISGRSYGTTPNQVVVANRMVRTCCGGCSSKVVQNPARYLAMLDEAKTDTKSN